jgi:hypothetical protein
MESVTSCTAWIQISGEQDFFSCRQCDLP